MGRSALRITADTNVLVRFIVRDDESQARVAERTLRRATRVIVTTACLCELIWVLSRTFGFSRRDLVDTLQLILEVPNIELHRETVLYGTAVLNAGGDFADGVIAYEGRSLGGESFVSFDRKAVARIRAQGHSAELL